MDWKKTGKKLLFPPVWVQAILAVLSAAGLALVFIKGWSETVPAYVIYVLSFYTLTVISLFCSMVLPKRWRQVRQKIYGHPLGNRYLTDKVFRTKVSLYLSLGVNLLYALINGVSYFLYDSWWFVCLAVYYAILSVMRFLLAGYVHSHTLGTDRKGERKRAVWCSLILLTLNFFLSGAVLMILYRDKGYDYGGIMIYVMALYTFYLTIHAIVELVKYRKFESPVLSTAKVISLAAALVSMLNLETAMFAQFGADMAPENRRLMIMLTGAGVSAAVIAMAIYTMVQAKKIKE